MGPHSDADGRPLSADLDAGHAVIRQIIPVVSDTTSGDYFIVYIYGVGGVPLKDALVGKDGVLMSLGHIAAGRQRPKLLEPAEAARQLSFRHGQARNAHYYFAGNNIEPGGSLYRPLIKAEIEAGEVLVSSSNGDVYLEESYAPSRGRREEETFDLGRKMQGRVWLVKQYGIGTLRKIDSLDVGK